VDEAQARYEAVDAVADQRLAATRLQVAALAGFMRTNHVRPFGVAGPNNEFFFLYPDVPDNYRTRLDAQWPVYDGGRRQSVERAARSDAAIASEDVEIARLDLRLEIASAYWTLITAAESTRVVEESLVRMDAHLRDVRNQLDAGLIPPNDVSSVEAQRSRQQMLSIQARANRDVAEAELARLIGVPVGTPIQPTTSAGAPVETTASVGALLSEAQQHRPEHRALRERVVAAAAREKAAAAGAKPTVSAVGGVDYSNPNPRHFPRQDAWQRSWDAGVNVSWSLFDGGLSRAEIAEAAANTRAARARLAEFDQLLAVEVRRRLSDLDAARASIAAAEDGVRAATEARRVAGDRFAAGVATSTDILDAQVALLQAGLDRTQAMASARLAEAQLARTIGTR
jgi:outer membrane protein TolC